MLQVRFQMMPGADGYVDFGANECVRVSSVSDERRGVAASLEVEARPDTRCSIRYSCSVLSATMRGCVSINSIGVHQSSHFGMGQQHCTAPHLRTVRCLLSRSRPPRISFENNHARGRIFHHLDCKGQGCIEYRLSLVLPEHRHCACYTRSRARSRCASMRHACSLRRPPRSNRFPGRDVRVGSSLSSASAFSSRPAF